MRRASSRLDVAFQDVDTFAHEGFRSGLLILVREMLRRWQAAGHAVGVLSIGGQTAAGGHGNLRKGRFGTYERVTNEIPVRGVAVERDLAGTPAEDIAALSRDLLSGARPRLVLTTTAAVFLHAGHVAALRAANDCGARVVCLVGDEFFPTHATHDARLVDAYWHELHRTRVVCISTRLRDRLRETIGVEAAVFPHLFPVKDIVARGVRSRRRFITLVNSHPVKGRAVFDAVAELMPGRRFLLQECWPDVPAYTPSAPTVTRGRFVADPRRVYAKTSLLLVPSLCQEGPARVVTEARLNGIPVVAHRIGSLPELAGLGVHFVNPPPMHGYRLDGTVLEPIIAPGDLARTARAFRDCIERVERGMSETVEREMRLDALAQCARAETVFRELSSTWW